MIEGLRNDIEEYLSKADFNGKTPHKLYAPITYIMGLKGKRIRPILATLAYHAISGKAPQQALALGCAIELFHNFTLIHDDIMDNAPMRRGKPTVHEKWDTNVAILSGDAVFAISVEWLVKDFPQKAADLVTTFTRTAVEVCEGQQEDMDLAERETAGIEDYLSMIRKKTSVLLGASLQLGAIAANADAELAALFYDFGVLAGIGFQLQDDYMDAYPPEGFGKQKGGDIIENKKTFLFLKALERANETQRKRLEDLLNEKNQEMKVNEALTLFSDLKIPEATQELIDHYFMQAKVVGAKIKEKVHYFHPLEVVLSEISERKV